MTDPEQTNLFENSPSTSPQQWEQIPFDPQVPIVPGTYPSLEQLADHCRQCQRCGLAQTRTQVVVSRGNPKADVMVIGEAPGQSEDEQGLPFVGKSGQLLDKILASVELSPEEDVYISNIVKCRPPENRNPSAPEIAACKPYLLEQISLVAPKIILLTGATALKGLTGEKKGISKIRGQWLEWEGYAAMAIFHPAYLLRNPSREKGKPKWLMWQDMQAVRQKLDQMRKHSVSL
ncbi:phage SPO1 DNA polymerase-related protein [Halothece sp. PCC 7418]|uniref:uracil-DNA glycosylase n=1 Tax=Halothece sp. (strain PCC 7418) TaxID=65093 RepID=UPI0002A078D1|nr:uracil-DNA glycosylase [Halothece sp. PCC 7418]AFZ43196.1 phage SPO1 DNA polymerase-related protein [Halothece sp. PCC 7418]